MTNQPVIADAKTYSLCATISCCWRRGTMNRLRRFLLTITTLLVLHQISPAIAENRYITVNLPESVIQNSLTHILPLSLDAATTTTEGTITIEEVSNLRLRDQHVSALIRLRGTDLVVKTKIADQAIRLQLGSAIADFDCDAELRYSASQQTLYVRPKPRNEKAEEALREGNIGAALLMLLNGQEYPLALHDIKPIVAQASDKTITIQTRIADISSIQGALQLSLIPVISTAP